MNIDQEEVDYEARFDGKWVLITNTEFSAETVALKYKELWQVEQVFRDVKSVKRLDRNLGMVYFLSETKIFW